MNLPMTSTRNLRPPSNTDANPGASAMAERPAARMSVLSIRRFRVRAPDAPRDHLVQFAVPGLSPSCVAGSSVTRAAGLSVKVTATISRAAVRPSAGWSADQLPGVPKQHRRQGRRREPRSGGAMTEPGAGPGLGSRPGSIPLTHRSQSRRLTRQHEDGPQ
jgi:hypothetical protein